MGKEKRGKISKTIRKNPVFLTKNKNVKKRMLENPRNPHTAVKFKEEQIVTESEEGTAEKPMEDDVDEIESSDETLAVDDGVEAEEVLMEVVGAESMKHPFIARFQRELSEELQLILSGSNPYQNRAVLDWPVLGKLYYSGICADNAPKNVSEDSTIFLKSEYKVISEPPMAPPKTPGEITLDSLCIKPQMHLTIPLANQKCIDQVGCHGPLTPLQNELLSLITNYYDVYFPERKFENEEEIRMAYCIHAANHILKTRALVMHHNAKMANKTEVPEGYRDQGFVRPKVLLLTPFKETALRIISTLISLILPNEKGNVINKKRFVEEYGGETLFFPKTNPKPEDYTAMFSGNVDDNFKIGLSVTKKAIKLYTEFYASDFIVASPLALRMVVGAETEKDRDYDFLSSIEVFIVDQADVFLMQNWDHFLHLVKHLHLQPITTHDTDFARIRPWALDNCTKFYSQMLVFSSLICPEHLALFSRYGKNYAGFVKVINPIFTSQISQITVQLTQVFQQFECDCISEMNDRRFEHFVKKVLPNFKGNMMSHTLIFVSSYFDYVRLRNHLRKEEESFVQICEYTKDNKIARARDLFYHGKKKFLLYTERVHFFRRLRLKGIGHIIFYQIPQYPHFYSELCNFVHESNQNRRVRTRKNPSVNVIYCRYDVTRLTSLVGTEKSNYILSSGKGTHAFVTEAF